MTKRVLVTGAAGFAGHHLLEHLLAFTDWHIVCIDGLTYAANPKRFDTIVGWDPDRISLHYWDLRSPITDDLDEDLGWIDAVYHLAANSHVDRSILDPVPFVSGNVLVTLHMLEWARQRPELSHFFQISTDEVYGPAEDGHSHKEWEPHVPSNPYAASKSAQESIAISYWRTYGIPLIITNTMNLFGERQDREKYLPKVIGSLSSLSKVTVHGQPLGNGEWRPGSRIWLHARNHADALLWLTEHIRPHRYLEGAARPSRYHVAGQVEVDNLEMVFMVADILNVDPLYEMVDFHASRPGHDLRYSLDSSKISSMGWKPPVSFDESLERTVLWERQHGL